SISYPLPLDHKWEATSGFRSELENPVTQFYRDGFYAMTLNVSNNECAASKTKFIHIGDILPINQNNSDSLEIIEEEKIMEENLNNNESIICKVSPNPSKNIFNIVLDGNVEAEYSVTNVLGEKICSGKVSGGKITFNAESWRAGVYLLFIRTDKQSKVIKLMKI
ncbi:MAG: T9SS type A sorting domain-containing protein, partial [Bacteroidales bacterium]|nr:T9SS type A sorting domain-containing protein [Bacteroidales bacterium]